MQDNRFFFHSGNVAFETIECSKDGSYSFRVDSKDFNRIECAIYIWNKYFVTHTIYPEDLLEDLSFDGNTWTPYGEHEIRFRIYDALDRPSSQSFKIQGPESKCPFEYDRKNKLIFLRRVGYYEIYSETGEKVLSDYGGLIEVKNIPGKFIYMNYEMGNVKIKL